MKAFHALRFLALLLGASCAATIEPPPPEEPEWPCHIGVWACSDRLDRLQTPCPRNSWNFSILNNLDDPRTAGCTAINYVAILPNGRVAQWLAEYVPSQRWLAGTLPPSLWYWEREGGDLVLTRLEQALASVCGNRDQVCSIPNTYREHRIPVVACTGDTFDVLATELEPDWSQALDGRLRPLGLVGPYEWMLHPQVCRRVEPALAGVIIRSMQFQVIGSHPDIFEPRFGY